MYIFTNALKNVVRNKGRNILMASIIFAIIVTTVAALMINNTASGIIDDYKNRFGTEVIIAFDQQKARALNGAIPSITDEQVFSFAESDYLKEYAMVATMDCFSNTLTAVGARPDAGSSFQGGNAGPDGEDYKLPTVKLLNNTGSDFKNGLREVMDGGRMPENDNECIISMDFSKLNNISVGDTIELLCNIYVDSDNNVRYGTYSLNVTGIYYDFTDETGGMHLPPAAPTTLNKRNEILTTFDTIRNILAPGESGMSLDAKYYLKEPSMLKDYEAELRGKGLADVYTVKIDEEGYNKVVGPVEGLRNLSFTFMIIVLILGAVVLILLASIAIRERKYEIGVLRAMGMKKLKVATVLWLEMLLITAACLVIGLGAGRLITQPVTDTLLKQQVESAQASQNSGMMSGGMSGSIGGNSSSGSNLTPLETLNVSLGMDTILEITAIALLLATVAGLASVSKITKYEPIKILMERN